MEKREHLPRIKILAIEIILSIVVALVLMAETVICLSLFGVSAPPWYTWIIVGSMTLLHWEIFTLSFTWKISQPEAKKVMVDLKGKLAFIHPLILPFAFVKTLILDLVFILMVIFFMTVTPDYKVSDTIHE